VENVLTTRPERASIDEKEKLKARETSLVRRSRKEAGRFKVKEKKIETQR